jgi:P pilus assembly chaperone PapD
MARGRQEFHIGTRVPMSSDSAMRIHLAKQPLQPEDPEKKWWAAVLEILPRRATDSQRKARELAWCKLLKPALNSEQNLLSRARAEARRAKRGTSTR